jgi:hypothetical protein
MSAKDDPFFLANVASLAAHRRTEHAGPGGLPWIKLTEAQKVPWIVKAYEELGGTPTKAEDHRIANIRGLADKLIATPRMSDGAYMPDVYEAETYREIGTLLDKILTSEGDQR